MLQNRDRHLCLRSGGLKTSSPHVNSGDKVTLQTCAAEAGLRARRKVTGAEDGGGRVARRKKKKKKEDGAATAASRQNPKVHVRLWEVKRRRKRVGREDEAKKKEKKKRGSSVAATQARGNEKNKVDVRTRHKGLCGCFERDRRRSAFVFPGQKKLDRVQHRSVASSRVSSRGFADHGRRSETPYLLCLGLLFLARVNAHLVDK